MALWVRVVGKPDELWGPYPESDVQEVAAFARIGASEGRHNRELLWTCKRKTYLLRVYGARGRLWPPDGNWLQVKDCVRRCEDCGERKPGRNPRMLGPASRCPCGGALGGRRRRW